MSEGEFMERRTAPDPSAGQLMCPSHGKLCKKGICSEMSKLVREEEGKKREAERGEVGGKVGFLFIFTSFSLFGLFFFFFLFCSSDSTLISCPFSLQV